MMRQVTDRVEVGLLILMGEFSSEELEIIDSTSRHYQSDIDPKKVVELLHSNDFSARKLRKRFIEDPSLWEDLTAEDWAAYRIDLCRDANWPSSDDSTKAGSNLASTAISTFQLEAAAGLQIIKDLDEFQRFRPSVELIFEIEDDDLGIIWRYMMTFEGSDYDHTITKSKEEMISLFKKWLDSDQSTEKIRLGLDIFEYCYKISEKGFPNILALKRVLDGERPDVDALQQIPATNVRRELVNVEGEPNSVFFDLIVEEFDSPLRNGLAHNDFVIDPPAREVRIPLEDTSYGYAEIERVVNSNVANSVFIAGTFRRLVDWCYIHRKGEHQRQRPDWVFGERSIAKEYLDQVDSYDSSN